MTAPASRRTRQKSKPAAKPSQLLMALEPRIMFDAAAAVAVEYAAAEQQAAQQAAEAAEAKSAPSKPTESTTPQPAEPGASPILALPENTPATLQAALQEAQTAIRDYLANNDAQALFETFKGQQDEASPEWLALAENLRQQILDGQYHVDVQLLDNAAMAGAQAGFAAQGPAGQPVIFINRDWLAAQTDIEIVTAVLVEELGHSIDHALNPNSDSAGDEGEIFAHAVIDGTHPQSAAQFASQNDHATFLIDGQTVQVELASMIFVNAYAMVYDLDNDTVGKAPAEITTAHIDTNERWADKEQNSHFFNTAGLSVAFIDDDTNSHLFSGNDVSAIGINIGGKEYFGWISRPIKAGGIVRGFYFWTDDTFTNLATAQADGNMDGDRNVLDNKGFLLVVDQTWFDQQIARKTEYTLNNAKDGSLGNVWVSNVGSSSDRVDSALNALVTSNTPPVATSETASGTPNTTLSTGAGNASLEEGLNTNPDPDTVITPSIPGSGNVLSNDTDGNNDTLSVTTVNSQSTGASATATASGVNLVGKYGTLTIKADGNWTYAPDNTNPTVNALNTQSLPLQERFTYTASDGKGGTASATLTVQINGSNDAPVAVNDYNVAKEITSSSNTGYNASGNVLANDTDVDDTYQTQTSNTSLASGDFIISGASVSGAATSATVTVTAGTTSIRFTTSNGFNSVTANTGATADEAYVHIGNKTPATGDVYTGLYTYNSGTGAYTLIYVTAKTASTTTTPGSITFNATPTHYWDTGTSSFKTIVNASTNQTLATFFANNPNFIFENTTDSTPTTGETYTQKQGNKYAVATATSGTGSTTLTGLSAQSGTIAKGMTVTGAGVPDGTTVTDVMLTNGVITSIVLSSDQITSPSGTTFTFTGNSGAGVTLTGTHGTVVINANGSYTYTPKTDNSELASGDSAVEVFDYTMQDEAGVTSPAKLYITVYGSGSNDPVVVADTTTTYESGVGRSTETPSTLTSDNTAFAGATLAVNVLSNDTAGAGGVVAAYTKADGSSSTAPGSTLTGTYGSVSITTAGVVTYTVDNTNNTVSTLLPGSTLTETFRYKVTNTAAGVNWSTLTITIQGTNDAPIAVADTAAVTEDRVLTATGNVLINDTDVDAGDTKTVSQAGTTTANTAVATGTTSANGQSINGTYGTLTIGADGTYRYVLATSTDATRYAALQALTDGQTANDVFNYEVKDTNGATSSTTLTITVTGTNEVPINQFNGTPISSTSSTSVTTAANTAIDFTGTKLLSVADDDTNLSSIILEVENGTLSFTSAPTGVTTLIENSSKTITISAGSQAQLNAALALLRYTPSTDFYGTDFLSINSADSLGGRDSDGIAINIPTNTTATVSDSNSQFKLSPRGAENHAIGIDVRQTNERTKLPFVKY